MKPISYVAAGILLNNKKKILISQRPKGKPSSGLWEFPGGKIETGETPETALVRELSEELSLTISLTDLKIFTFISHDCSDFHLIMYLYFCNNYLGIPRGNEQQNIAWVDVDDLCNYCFPGANSSLIPNLQRHFKNLSLYL